MASHFPTSSLSGSSLVDQVRRVLAGALGPKRHRTRTRQNRIPGSSTRGPNPGSWFYLRIRCLDPWCLKKQPSSHVKAGENSPHLLGSIGKRESKKNRLRAGGQSFPYNSLPFPNLAPKLDCFRACNKTYFIETLKIGADVEAQE